MASQLFKTKSPELLIRESEAPERLMKRSLSALDLTALGIGAIIGTGIFALTGTAAAGERLLTSKLGTPVLDFIQSW
ncbi:MAG: amino acid permease, partial [Chthoniobacterales bacterium]